METLGIMKSKLFLLFTFILLSQNFVYTQTASSNWPKKVLITNDDGINDEKMIALANAFSKIAETYVIAPSENRSGTTHFLSVYSKHILNVKKQDTLSNIKFYSVDGYPADCVFLALNGIMKNNLPDLVISGINDGPNLGDDWIASGTIGAARMAAHWGVPAISVSGFKGNNKEDLEKVISWIINFAQSKIVRQLKSGQYLTVSFPQIPVDQFKGIKITSRAGSTLNFEMRKIDEQGDSEVWTIMPPNPVSDFPTDTDAAYYYKSYVVVVPMVADEVDYILLNSLKDNINMVPNFNK
jgi:5'-nucleotidase